MGYDIRIQDVASLAEWASGVSSSVGRQLEAVGVAAGGVAALDDFRGQAASNARAYWGDAVAPVAKALGVAFQDLATRCALYAEPYTGGEIDSCLDAHLEQGSIQDAAGQLGDMRSDLSQDASDLSSTLEPALGILGCDAPDEGPADGALSDAATVADDLDKRVSEHESWHSGDCGRDFEEALSGLQGSLSRLGSYAGGASYAPGDLPQSPQGQDLSRSAAASGAYVGEHRAAAQAAMQRTAQREQEAAEAAAPVFFSWYASLSDEQKAAIDTAVDLCQNEGRGGEEATLLTLKDAIAAAVGADPGISFHDLCEKLGLPEHMTELADAYEEGDAAFAQRAARQSEFFGGFQGVARGASAVGWVLVGIDAYSTFQDKSGQIGDSLPEDERNVKAGVETAIDVGAPLAVGLAGAEVGKLLGAAVVGEEGGPYAAAVGGAVGGAVAGGALAYAASKALHSPQGESLTDALGDGAVDVYRDVTGKGTGDAADGAAAAGGGGGAW